MDEYVIYTDGSYRASKNQGGIGVLWIRNGEIVQEFSKTFKDTTNNKMELGAIKIALASIKKPIQSLEIITDSEYSIGCITNPTWKPKKNVELINSIKRLLVVAQNLVKEPIKFSHVKGHAGNEYNERVDYLAQTASNYD